MYKIGNLDGSEKYLKEYLKTGSSKVAKTYLYLSTIEKRKSYNKKKLSLIKLYNDYSRRADNLFGEEFELLHIYDKNQDDDIVKLKLLNNELMKKRISE